MTEEQYYDDIDFSKKDLDSVKLLKSYEPVVILPGLLIGTHNSVIDFIDVIRKRFGKNKIRVFCHTWEVEQNKIWIESLKRVCKETDHIELNIITEPYNSEKLIKFYGNLRTNFVGSDNNGFVDSVFMKRYIVFYSMVRIYEEWLKDLSSSTYIFKFRSALALEEDTSEDFLEHIGDYKRRAGPDTWREYYLNTFPLDMFLSNVINFKGVSEVMFSTSITTFKKLFGTSVDELSDRATSVLLSWIDRCKLDVKLDNDNFEEMTKNFGIFPYSGALQMQTLLDLYCPNLMVGVTRIRHTMLNSRWDNPIINVKDRKVWIHKQDFKTDANRLHQYIINYKKPT